MSIDSESPSVGGVDIPALGWNPDDEAKFRDQLSEITHQSVSASLHEIPKVVDLLSVLDRPSQGDINQCSGFGLSNAQRAIIYMDTGRVVWISGSFAYAAAKSIEGTPRNVDGGATISAAALAAARVGAAMVEEFPNWQQKAEFYNRWPDSRVFQRADNRRNLSVCELPSARAFAAFCGTGQGFGIMGIWWVEELNNYRGGDLPPIKIPPSGRNFGGHCVSILGYKFDADDLYLDLANSHPGWGWKGFNRAWVHERVVDHWIRTGPFGPMKGIGRSTGFKKTTLRLTGEIG